MTWVSLNQVVTVSTLAKEDFRAFLSERLLYSESFDSIKYNVCTREVLDTSDKMQGVVQNTPSIYCFKNFQDVR